MPRLCLDIFCVHGLWSTNISMHSFSAEDIALDWVGNNLYWTESVTGNIEVLDLNANERALILNTGMNSLPRGIALDPATRYARTPVATMNPFIKDIPEKRQGWIQ